MKKKLKVTINISLPQMKPSFRKLIKFYLLLSCMSRLINMADGGGKVINLSELIMRSKR
jgi:hypothetical protein